MTEVTGAALAVALVVLLGVGGVTARRPVAPVPGLADHLERWSALHAGIDPHASRWVHGWLVGMYHLARPLARAGVRPDLLTLLGLWWAAAAAVVAAAGGRWPLLATVMLILGAVLDGLDGAVAVLTGRVTRWGGVLDALVDRLSDLVSLLAVVLVAAAVPGAGRVAPLVLTGAVAAGAALVTLEVRRARAGQLGATLAVITVGERPTRLVLTGLTLWCAGLLPGRAAPVAAAGVWSVTLVALIGVGQLARHARRELR